MPEDTALKHFLEKMALWLLFSLMILIGGILYTVFSTDADVRIGGGLIGAGSISFFICLWELLSPELTRGWIR